MPMAGVQDRGSPIPMIDLISERARRQSQLKRRQTVPDNRRA